MLANDPVTGLLTLCVAVQADLLETAHVADACAAWIAAPTASLPELLVARGWLDTRGRAELERLVTERLAQYGLSAAAALSDLGSRPRSATAAPSSCICIPGRR